MNNKKINQKINCYSITKNGNACKVLKKAPLQANKTENKQFIAYSINEIKSELLEDDNSFNEIEEMMENLKLTQYQRNVLIGRKMNKSPEQISYENNKEKEWAKKILKNIVNKFNSTYKNVKIIKI